MKKFRFYYKVFYLGRKEEEERKVTRKNHSSDPTQKKVVIDKIIDKESVPD